MGAEPPVACSLTSAQLADRAAAWRHVIEGWGVQRRRLPGAVEIRFRADPGVAETVGELAALERECCPWFESTVSVEETVVLEMRSSDDGVAVLAATFGVD